MANIQFHESIQQTFRRWKATKIYRNVARKLIPSYGNYEHQFSGNTREGFI